MSDTSPVSIQEGAGCFMAVPCLCGSEAIMGGGAGQARERARWRWRRAAAAVVAALALATVGPMRAADATGWTGLTPYATTNWMTATNKPPGAWDQPGTNSMAVKAGAKIWLAFLNTENPNLRKYFRLVINAGSQADANGLHFLDGDGFDANGNAVGKNYPNSGNNMVDMVPVAGEIYWEYVFTPQPAWERLSFINQSGHDINITIKAWSACALARPSLKTLTSSNTTFGAVGGGVMKTNQQIRQVWVFPKTVPLNPGVQPQFWAPPATGPWNFQFTPTGPYGGTHPLGVRWVTGGSGLAPGQAVSFSFEMQGQQADWGYTMIAFDGTTGAYQEWNLNLLPDLSIGPDINGVALHFDSVSGMVHTLERSADSTTWQQFQSQMGTGQSVSIPFPTNPPQQFFRFKVP